MASKLKELTSPYDMVERAHSPLSQQIYNDFKDSYSSHAFDLDVQLVDAFRRQYPKHILTCVPAGNCNLLYYAAAGYASATLDTETETVHRVRGYIRGPRRSVKGDLADGIRFGKYNYTWLSEDFIVYMVALPYFTMFYVLKEPSKGEQLTGRSSMTDNLVRAIGEWQEPDDNDHVLCKSQILVTCQSQLPPWYGKRCNPFASQTCTYFLFHLALIVQRCLPES